MLLSKINYQYVTDQTISAKSFLYVCMNKWTNISMWVLHFIVQNPICIFSCECVWKFYYVHVIRNITSCIRASVRLLISKPLNLKINQVFGLHGISLIYVTVSFVFRSYSYSFVVLNCLSWCDLFYKQVSVSNK